MSATLTTAKPARASSSRAQATGGVDLGRDSSRDARRVAAAILEVLAGARTPSEAAAALALSVTHYYKLESRALRGLLAACEARPKGRVGNPQRDMTALRRDNERLQREVIRQQALVRAAQRTMGLPPPAAPAPGKTAGKKARTRKVARALTVAARLHLQQQDPSDAVSAAVAVPSTSSSSPLDGEGHLHPSPSGRGAGGEG